MLRFAPQLKFLFINVFSLIRFKNDRFKNLSLDLSDSTLSYTETEAASSPNATQGEFSG